MHMRSIRLLLAAALVGSLSMAACDKNGDDELANPPRPGPGDASRPSDATRPGGPVRAEGTRPGDNTAQNKGDAAVGAKTPFDQSEDPADIKITAQVRKDILAKDELSANADNVKIITSGGVVTLRGVVDSQAESDAVANVAKSVPGVSRVDNQLVIEAHR